MSVKKAAQKLSAVLLVLVLLFSLGGCASKADFLSGSFLSPPKPSGDMYYIQQALDESVDGKYTLKYPTAGQYRSAYILADLMGTGNEEFALAFYSVLSSENVVSLHLNLMKKVDDQWVSLSDVSVSATGVEKVILNDLDGDGISEIIVGWNIYGGVDKRITVYTLRGLSLIPLMQESYTDILCCDLEESGTDKLFVLNHDTASGIAIARLFGFDGENVAVSGNCVIDGSVTSFYEPVITCLSNGKPAVFIDAVKGSGTQTEIIYVKDGLLTRANIIINEEGTLATYRGTSVLCSDINSDGRYDIPITDSALSFTPAASTSLASLIKWCSFDGVDFTVSMVAAMNYSDGYYLEIPTRWFGKITIETDVEYRMYTVSVWNTEENTKVGELFKLRTLTDTEWDKENNGLDAYTEISRNESLVYVAAIGNYSGVEQTGLDEISSLVHIIG